MGTDKIRALLENSLGTVGKSSADLPQDIQNALLGHFAQSLEDSLRRELAGLMRGTVDAFERNLTPMEVYSEAVTLLRTGHRIPPRPTDPNESKEV